jgi:biopolymer transport protein ExbD
MIWNPSHDVSYYKATLMAELNLPQTFKKRIGVQCIKKANLKIDMTPMVDLGFLLVTFFVFTTQISQPSVTNLYMPHDGVSTKIADSKSLTFLLGNDNHVYYYFGNIKDAVKSNKVFQTTYDEFKGMGNIIRLKQNELEQRKIDRKELIVLIKPDQKTSYKNMMYAIDEMLINEVTRYALLDISNEEETFLKRKR